jgi:hypothetical protein
MIKMSIWVWPASFRSMMKDACPQTEYTYPTYWCLLHTCLHTLWLVFSRILIESCVTMSSLCLEIITLSYLMVWHSLTLQDLPSVFGTHCVVSILQFITLTIFSLKHLALFSFIPPLTDPCTECRIVIVL